MQTKLQKYEMLLDKSPLAVRVIVLVTLLIISYVLWQALLWQDIRKKSSELKTNIATYTAEIETFKVQLKSLEDIQKQLKPEIKETQPEQKSEKVISAEKIAELLHSLIDPKNNLVLYQFQTFPPKNITEVKSLQKLFEYGFLIKFHGDFFSTLNFLQAVERLNWRLSWDKLEYKVIQYPEAEITLYLHTVSDKDGWIHI